jgi:hypothetical protein
MRKAINPDKMNRPILLNIDFKVIFYIKVSIIYTSLLEIKYLIDNKHNTTSKEVNC